MCHVVVILVVSMQLYPTATAEEILILIFSLRTENIFLVMMVCGSGGHCAVFLLQQIFRFSYLAHSTKFVPGEASKLLLQ